MTSREAMGRPNSRTRAKVGLTFVAIVATLAITACSAAPANDEEHDDPDIVLTEFAVSPDPIVVATDTRIVFTVRNDGGIFHELRFTNAERIADHLGEGDEDHDSDNAEHSEDETGQDVVIELDPGESGQVELVVPESEDVYTEAVCLVPGHYEAGMAASLVYARP